MCFSHNTTSCMMVSAFLLAAQLPASMLALAEPNNSAVAAPDMIPTPQAKDHELISTEIIIPTTKAAAERAASLLNILASSASLLGAVCSVTKSSCAGPAFLASGATWAASSVATHLAIELGDANFEQVATPSGPEVDLSRLSPSTRPLVSTLVQAIVVTNAIYTTANRATAAAKAGSTYWIARHAAALETYQVQLSQLLDQLKGDQIPSPSEASVQERLKQAIISYQTTANTLRDKLQINLEAAGFRFVLSCLPKHAEGAASRIHKALCHELGAALGR